MRLMASSSEQPKMYFTTGNENQWLTQGFRVPTISLKWRKKTEKVCKYIRTDRQIGNNTDRYRQYRVAN